MKRGVETHPGGHFVQTVVLVRFPPAGGEYPILEIPRDVQAAKHEGGIGHAQGVHALQFVGVHLGAGVPVLNVGALCQSVYQCSYTGGLACTGVACNNDAWKRDLKLRFQSLKADKASISTVMYAVLIVPE